LNSYVLSKLKEWRSSSLLFATECLGVKPSDQQAAGLVAMDKSKRTTIRSGHGTGKDAFASWKILQFLTTRAYPKVVCTAPTNRQLSDILWSELSKWLRQSIVADEFVIQSDKIFHKDAPKEWWCRAVSASVKASKEDQAETLAGFHGEHLLIVVDEASGVMDPVYVPLEGAMTQEDNHVLLIGNMTKGSGYFYDTHFHPTISTKWCKLHWDSRKSSNVKKEMVEYFAEKYGEDSNIFRIRIMGEPPVDDTASFIPLSWGMSCVGNEIFVDPDWPISLSVDVAREGDDESIILPRRGFKIYTWEAFKEMHTIALSNKVVTVFSDLDASIVGVDSIGVGGGVVDWLRHDPRGLGIRKTCAVNVAEAATDNKKHHRLRDQLWDTVRYNCMRTNYSFPDVMVRRNGMDLNIGQELANELASVRYFNDKNGAIQIESKLDMKRRGVRSPNIADALCISEYISPTALAMWKSSAQGKKLRSQSRHYQHQSRSYSRDSWMTA
jgi:hypothetical protein